MNRFKERDVSPFFFYLFFFIGVVITKDAPILNSLRRPPSGEALSVQQKDERRYRLIHFHLAGMSL